ncbi:hypothetical protein JTB14_016407 [Gonioctena quinquepunctata]|nr:hypothetical protein JTB14_016407 [Gonioctena quinquepunctata]
MTVKTNHPANVMIIMKKDFSGDSDYGPDEPPLIETWSKDDNNEVIFPATETGGQTLDNSDEENPDNNLQENQSSTENGNDASGWGDKSSDILNLDFDSSQTGKKINGIQNLSPIEDFSYRPDFSNIKLILPALCVSTAEES